MKRRYPHPAHRCLSTKYSYEKSPKLVSPNVRSSANILMTEELLLAGVFMVFNLLEVRSYGPHQPKSIISTRLSQWMLSASSIWMQTGTRSSTSVAQAIASSIV